MAAQPSPDESIQDQVLEFLARRRRGEPLSVEAFLGEHPAHRAALERALREALQRLVDVPGSGATVSLGTELGSSRAAASEGSAERTIALGDAPSDVDRRAAAPVPLEQVIDQRYEVVRVLGQGGFGRVYLVRDRLYQGELRALKTILAEHSAKPEFEKRFQNEIRIERALSHSGIPQIYNDGKTAAGEFYYTMAFVDGQSLADVLTRSGPLPPERVVRLVRQMLTILEYAHGKGVVHRDLKPSNVMLVRPGTPEEEVKILDFGIAKVLRREGELEGAGSMNTVGGIGTPLYMSPEQVRGQEVDARSDIYALGIIIYQMCSGLFPFSGKSDIEILTARLERPPTPLDADSAPEWLRTVVMQLLERNRDRRPSTKEIQDRFERLTSGQHEISRTLRWVAAGILAVALGVAWLLWRVEPVPRDADGHATGAKPPPARAFAAGVTLEQPADGAHLAVGRIDVAGLAPGQARVQVNDVSCAVDAQGRFRTTLDLRENSQATITVRAEDGQVLGERTLVVDTERPVLDFVPPGRRVEGTPVRYFVGSKRVPIAGRASDKAPGALDRERFEIDGRSAVLEADGSFAVTLDLEAEGDHPLSITVRDRAGNVTPSHAVLSLDTLAPKLVLDPLPQAPLDADAHKLVGRIDDPNPGWITVEREAVDGPQTRVEAIDGRFEIQLSLFDGENRATLIAFDAAGNRSTAQAVSISRAKPKIRLADVVPANGISLPPTQDRLTIRGRASGPLGELTINGAQAQIVAGDAFELDVAVAEGPNSFRIVPYDAQNTTGIPLDLAVTRQRANLPPGCSIVGTELDASNRPRLVRHDATGIELVLVPEGSLARGSGSTPIGAYYLGRTEVTRAQFGRADGGAGPEHPMTEIDFEAARSYCREKGLRLATESEWEYAARGASALLYPWGDVWDPSASNVDAVGILGTNAKWRTAPVATHPRDVAWCGAFDLAGNVSEWCTADDAPARRALRGGSWTSDEKGCKLDATKVAPRDGTDYIGFRVALDLER